jgi:Uma2 family endonuclease
MATQIERHRFTVDDYSRMLQSGILTEDDRVELIDGEVVEMSPIGSLHTGTVKQLAELLFGRLAGRVNIGVQDPVELSDYTEPQPDISVLRRRTDYYKGGHAGPDDVLLIIEVGDTSAAYDREEKLPRYALAGIPEVWLVDLEQFVVTQYASPRGNAYEHAQVHVRGQTIDCRSIADLRVAVVDILGPA